MELDAVVPDLECFATDLFAGLEESGSRVAGGCHLDECFITVGTEKHISVDVLLNLSGEAQDHAASDIWRHCSRR